MRFLIDECLSPLLASVAHGAGFAADHLAHIGKGSSQDWNIAEFALANDMVLVTNNAVDFRLLYRRHELHPGLILILPSVSRQQEARLFAFALAVLSEMSDLTNKVLEVDFFGKEPAAQAYDLFSG